jgi:hypothetical protein
MKNTKLLPLVIVPFLFLGCQEDTLPEQKIKDKISIKNNGTVILKNEKVNFSLDKSTKELQSRDVDNGSNLFIDYSFESCTNSDNSNNNIVTTKLDSANTTFALSHVDGLLNQSLALIGYGENGSDGQFITGKEYLKTADISHSNTNEFTFMGWINLEEYDSGVLSKSGGEYNNKEYYLYVDSNGKLKLKLFDKFGSPYEMDLSKDELDKNKWYFFGATLEIKDNGHLQTKTNLYDKDDNKWHQKNDEVKNYNGYPTDISNPIYIGGLNFTGDTVENYFHGQMDEVKVFEGRLDKQRIKNIANLEKDGTSWNNVSLCSNESNTTTPSVDNERDDVQDFELAVFNTANIPAIEVDGLLVQSNNIVLSNNKAFISYNYAGDEFKGALQVIDITDPYNIKIDKEITFSHREINAIYYEEEKNELYFGGATTPEVSNKKSFVTVVDLNEEFDKTKILNNIVELDSSSVTGITKAKNTIYVTVGAKDGGVYLFEDNLTAQVSFTKLDDLRDVINNEDYVVGLKGDTDTDTNPSIVVYDFNSTKKYQIEDLDSDYHKASIEFFNDKDKLYSDEDFNVLTAEAKKGLNLYSLKDDEMKKVYTLENPFNEKDNTFYYTNSVTSGDGYVFVANGGYGFRILQFNGLNNFDYTYSHGYYGLFFDFLNLGFDNLETYTSENEDYKIFDYVGHHKLEDNSNFSVNELKYNNNLLFAASGRDGVNVYFLTHEKEVKNVPLPTDMNLSQGIVEDFKLEFNSDAQVAITLVKDTGGYKNSIGYVTLNDNNNKDVLFKNASFINSGGVFKNGDTLSFDVKAEDSITPLLVQNGGKYQYTRSNKDITCLKDVLTLDGKNHCSIIRDDVNEVFYVGLEDMTNLGDKDFNDNVISIKVSPWSAIK